MNNSHGQHRQRKRRIVLWKSVFWSYRLRAETHMDILWFESCAEYKRAKRAQLEFSATRMKHVFRHEDKSLCSILDFWLYTDNSYWIKSSRERSHLKEIFVWSFVDGNCCWKSWRNGIRDFRFPVFSRVSRPLYFFAMHLYQSTLIGHFPSGYQKLAF